MREAIALHKQQIPSQLNNSIPFSNIIKQAASEQQQNIHSSQTNVSNANQTDNNSYNNETPTNDSSSTSANNKTATNNSSTILSTHNSLELNSDPNQTQQRMLIDDFLSQMNSIPHDFIPSLSSLPTNSSSYTLNSYSSQATVSETNALEEV